MLVVRVLALVFLCGCGARTELDVPDACAAREITLQVPAQSAWTDTGIDVTAGETLVIDAPARCVTAGRATKSRARTAEISTGRNSFRRRFFRTRSS